MLSRPEWEAAAAALRAGGSRVPFAPLTIPGAPNAQTKQKPRGLYPGRIRVLPQSLEDTLERREEPEAQAGAPVGRRMWWCSGAILTCALEAVKMAAVIFCDTLDPAVQLSTTAGARVNGVVPPGPPLSKGDLVKKKASVPCLED